VGVSALLLTGGPPTRPRRDTSAACAHRALCGARVTIKGYAFTPKTLTVVPGTTVTWTNKDRCADYFAHPCNASRLSLRGCVK